ncbi:MAG: hypothetical protein AAF447_22335, partial [Myxococcota bacterium]
MLGLTLMMTSGALHAQRADDTSSRLTTHSEVTLSVENGPGTSREELGAFSALVGRQLSAVRECYERVSAERPHVDGTLRLRAILEAGGGRVVLARDDLGDAELRRCAVAAVAAAPYGELRPPGSAYVTLTFTNSAAAEAQRLRERGPTAVAVTRTDDGGLETRGGTPAGEVQFVVTAGAGAPEAQLRGRHATVRTHRARH